MANALPEKNTNDVVNSVVLENPGPVECAVCLQTCVHPAELPCGHIFCYLCIKGIVNQGRRCAMCRHDIPIDFLDKPRLLKPFELETDPQGFEDGHQWFYEGHNGWWQYDERTSMELESAYQKGERCCELLVAGFLYIADFDSMLQFRRHDPGRRRRIKRDLATTTSKGVAGLKVIKTQEGESRSNIVSSVLIPGLQNLHISGRGVSSGRFSRTRSGQFRRSSSRENLESGHREGRRHSFSPPRRTLFNSSDSDESPANSSPTRAEHLDALYTGNLELDTMIHNTLDWTIQQIESLHIELTNDYETLSQEVEEYERLQSALDLWPGNQSSNTSLNTELPSSLISERTVGLRLNRSEENVSNAETPVRTSMRDRILMRSRSSTGFIGGSRVWASRNGPRRSSSLRTRHPSLTNPEAGPH